MKKVYRSEKELVESIETLTGLKMVFELVGGHESVKCYRLESPTGVPLMQVTLIHTAVVAEWTVGGMEWILNLRQLL